MADNLQSIKKIRKKGRPPITIDRDGDVAVYGTTAEAEAALEPADLEDERLSVYDADGCLLRLARAPRWPLARDVMALRLSDRAPDLAKLEAEVLT